MKKIFRMALVFALAGATLMYTGCTKDYMEDINNVDNKVDAIQKDLSDKIADLSSKVATLSSSLSTLEGTLSTLKGDVSDLKTRVKTLEDAVKNCATKEDVATLEGKINQLKTDILAVTDDLQNQLNELKGATEEQIAELQAALDEVYAALGDGLTSIVFIPDFYYGGIEATSYDFLDLYPHTAVKGPAETVDHNGTAVVFSDKAIITYTADSTKKFTLGQIGIANYDINPSTFPLDSATWALHGMDKKYVVVEAAETKAEVKTWKPVFVGIAYKDDAPNGIPYAAVNYTIENPELLSYEDNVPVMHLEATLGDGKFVSSDWEAVVSGTEEIAHLAFAKTNAYKTAEPEQCDTTAKKDLYYRADTCAQHIPSIEVQYNGGPIDLEPLVATHINNPITGITEYSLEKLNAKYPGFTYKFELVPFTSGENVTGEDYYGKIDGSEFTPCWVASEGGKPVSKPIAEGSEEGLSAVGRTPIVLVTLINAEKVVAYGYFKVVIKKEAKDPETKELGPVDFGKIPFVCEPYTKKITWYDFSHFVLEKLQMDYDEFTDTYTVTYLDEENKIVDAYVKNADGTFSAIGDKYGEVIYNKDTKQGTINDVFEWTVDPQKIGEGKSQTIYVRFADENEMSILYFELTAEVAAAAKFDFGANKLNNEWYDDIKGEYMNTARVNVPVPVADKTSPVKGGDVTKFQRDLNHFFVGYKPGIELAADADSIYLSVPDSLLETTATYTFSAAQDKIVDWDGTEFQLFTNKTFDSLFVKAKFDEDGKVVPDAAAKADTTTLIAYLTSGESEGTDAEGNADAEAGDETTGGAAAEEEEEEEANIKNNVIVYSWAEGNTLAKYFLNLWGLNDNEKDETMLHANVTVDITYGECNIPAGKENFHVRFIRPLDINFQGQGINEESAVDGANVEIAKFINGITDWNHQRVIVPEKDSTGAETGYYTANVIKTVDMYAYYQFDSLIINIGLAERDNWNVKDTAEYKAIKDVTPAVKLQLGTLDEDEVFTAMTPDTDEDGNEFYAVDIADFDSIKDLVINYRNDEAYVEAFNIRIPIKIGYAWGYYVAYFEINILDTGSTTPKKPAR